MNDLIKRNGNGLSLFDEVFGGPFNDIFSSSLYNRRHASGNVIEYDDRYVVEMEVPGLTKDDIEVAVENNVLSIRAHQETSNEQKDGDGKYLSRRIEKRNYNYSVRLGNNVDVDNIHGNVENGMLLVNLPKKEIEVGTSKKFIELE